MSSRLNLINFAGTPPTIEFSVTSFVTTEFAPTTELSSIVTPSRMKALAQIQTLSPINISPSTNLFKLFISCVIALM